MCIYIYIYTCIILERDICIHLHNDDYYKYRQNITVSPSSKKEQACPKQVSMDAMERLVEDAVRRVQRLRRAVSERKRSSLVSGSIRDGDVGFFAAEIRIWVDRSVAPIARLGEGSALRGRRSGVRIPGWAC